ncbi:dihydrofolate reductase [Legionella sp. km772]|uniref:dihydrofolate reductase n=1 Tax=Legionella sp. km772 TaxID=2498111 RepID=UPI000F8DD62B|nr:dihydrofolate reductase [Legionella sp. km772]RUR12443.1 dihydrofolate reductase [Legionella sp. km772]
MALISLIAALDEQNGIGINNQLLTHLPADLKYFKAVTMGKPIIMGRRTYESIGKPLPGRKNIVISKTLGPQNGLTVLSNLEQALELTKDEPEIMIIGGGQLFAKAILQASRLYITKIHHHFNADVFFPPIEHSIWKCTEEQKHGKDEKNPYDMSFLIYERKPYLRETNI